MRNPSQDWKQKKLGGKSVSLFLQIWEECTHTRASSGDEPVGIKKRTADCGQRTVRRAQGIKHGLGTKWGLETTIPDKTTWESFPHHVHFPTQQNYFQNDAFAERKPLPPIQCCFPQTSRDQAFFWIHNNIAFGGRGRGKNRYSYENAVQVYNFFNSFVQDCTDWTEYKTRTRYKTRTTDCVYKTALERLLRETGQAD